MRLAGLAAAVLACAMAAPACSQPPAAPHASAKTQMPAVTLSRETPRREIPVPAGLAAPKALAVRLDPAAGGPGFGLEVWLLRPGAERLRLGAVAPYPAGEPGEFLIPWPAELAGRAAPAGSRLEVALTKNAAGSEAPAAARVSVSFR